MTLYIVNLEDFSLGEELGCFGSLVGVEGYLKNFYGSKRGTFAVVDDCNVVAIYLTADDRYKGNLVKLVRVSSNPVIDKILTYRSLFSKFVAEYYGSNSFTLYSGGLQAGASFLILNDIADMLMLKGFTLNDRRYMSDNTVSIGYGYNWDVLYNYISFKNMTVYTCFDGFYLMELI